MSAFRAIVIQELTFANRALLAAILCVAASHCQANTTPTTVELPAPDLIGTNNPFLSMTLQAEVKSTAIILLPAGTPTATSPASGTPALSALITPIPLMYGACSLPDNYSLQVRQGFCIAIPQSWSVLNIDGGMASTLHTTPGQAISIRPDWADLATVCNMLIYIASEPTESYHLQTRYNEIALNIGLSEITPIAILELGGNPVVGFQWADASETGGIYALSLGLNRLLHISHRGSDCAIDRLNEVFTTFRIQ